MFQSCIFNCLIHLSISCLLHVYLIWFRLLSFPRLWSTFSPSREALWWRETWCEWVWFQNLHIGQSTKCTAVYDSFPFLKHPGVIKWRILIKSVFPETLRKTYWLNLLADGRLLMFNKSFRKDSRSSMALTFSVWTHYFFLVFSVMQQIKLLCAHLHDRLTVNVFVVGVMWNVLVSAQLAWTTIYWSTLKLYTRSERGPWHVAHLCVEIGFKVPQLVTSHKITKKLTRNHSQIVSVSSK